MKNSQSFNIWYRKRSKEYWLQTHFRRFTKELNAAFARWIRSKENSFLLSRTHKPSASLVPQASLSKWLRNSQKSLRLLCHPHLLKLSHRKSRGGRMLSLPQWFNLDSLLWCRGLNLTQTWSNHSRRGRKSRLPVISLRLSPRLKVR